MSVIQAVQLSLEKAILRLETFKAVTPTLENIQGVFNEVRETLENVARVMPSLTPELNNLMSSINDLMVATEITLTPPEPVVIRNEHTEAILKEASDFLKQELERKIPEPPEEKFVPEPPKPAKPVGIKPRIALTVDGSEVYVGEDGSVINEESSRASALAEELVLDYIERNKGEMNISKCSRELNMPQNKVMEMLESLSRKGKIRIE